MGLIYYPIAILAAFVAVSTSLDAARLTAAACAHLSLSGSTDLAWKSLLETLSFSLYSGATESRQGVEALFAEAARRERIAGVIGLALVALTLVQVVLVRWRSDEDVNRRLRSLIGHMLAIAILFLVAGVVAPVLSLRAYTDLPVLETVVFKFDSKSIVSTIAALVASGNLFVGILVMLFSIVIPVAKLIMAACVVQGWFPSWQTHALHMIKAIGKWSMADVFVVSIMLAFLAMRGDEFSDARLGIGLYLFAGYCLLSQWSAHLLLRHAGSADPAPSASAPAAHERPRDR